VPDPHAVGIQSLAQLSFKGFLCNVQFFTIFVPVIWRQDVPFFSEPFLQQILVIFTVVVHESGCN
jgi:hypothetical protein